MPSKACVLVATWSIVLPAALAAHARTQRSAEPPSTQADTVKNEPTAGQSPRDTSVPDTSSSKLEEVIKVVVSEVAGSIDRTGKSNEELTKLVIQGLLADVRVLSGIQRSLLELGYAPGPPSGQMTPETRSAIKEFLAVNGLVGSGDVSNDLVVRLLTPCQVRVVNFNMTPVGACAKPKESGVPGVGVIELR